MQYLWGASRGTTAELRREVQRMTATATKGKNIIPYTRYIADGLKGRHGRGLVNAPGDAVTGGRTRFAQRRTRRRCQRAQDCFLGVSKLLDRQLGRPLKRV